jgi:hypothetical protein
MWIHRGRFWIVKLVNIADTLTIAERGTAESTFRNLTAALLKN